LVMINYVHNYETDDLMDSFICRGCFHIMFDSKEFEIVLMEGKTLINICL
jgi:hypothetical protein